MIIIKDIICIIPNVVQRFWGALESRLKVLQINQESSLTYSRGSYRRIWQSTTYQSLANYVLRMYSQSRSKKEKKKKTQPDEHKFSFVEVGNNMALQPEQAGWAIDASMRGSLYLCMFYSSIFFIYELMQQMMASFAFFLLMRLQTYWR